MLLVAQLVISGVCITQTLVAVGIELLWEWGQIRERKPSRQWVFTSFTGSTLVLSIAWLILHLTHLRSFDPILHPCFSAIRAAICLVLLVPVTSLLTKALVIYDAFEGKCIARTAIIILLVTPLALVLAYGVTSYSIYTDNLSGSLWYAILSTTSLADAAASGFIVCHDKPKRARIRLVIELARIISGLIPPIYYGRVEAIETVYLEASILAVRSDILESKLVKLWNIFYSSASPLLSPADGGSTHVNLPPQPDIEQRSSESISAQSSRGPLVHKSNDSLTFSTSNRQNDLQLASMTTSPRPGGNPSYTASLLLPALTPPQLSLNMLYSYTKSGMVLTEQPAQLSCEKSQLSLNIRHSLCTWVALRNPSPYDYVIQPFFVFCDLLSDGSPVKGLDGTSVKDLELKEYGGMAFVGAFFELSFHCPGEFQLRFRCFRKERGNVQLLCETYSDVFRAKYERVV